MAACTPSIHVFLGLLLFRLSSGIHSIINCGILILSSGDNIKMDFQEVGGGRGDWMELAQDRDRWLALVSTVKNLRVP
jgi:hypothetical protein